MLIEGVVWLRDIVDKLAVKHHIEPYEVEEALDNRPKVRFAQKEAERARTFIWPWARLTPADTWQCCSYTRSRGKR